MQQDSYLTIRTRVLVETAKVKGSRFIAEAVPVHDDAEAEVEIAAVRKREHNATHHCTAYRIGAGGAVVRFNDDGEPSGTAGQPILRQIEGRRLTNVLVVVTRYFGGTKLGTGGLIRAYADAASQVLDACQIEECIIRIPVRLRFDYDDTSPAMHVLNQFDAPILEMNYSDTTEIIAGVRRSQVESLAAAFREALSGRGSVE